MLEVIWARQSRRKLLTLVRIAGLLARPNAEGDLITT